MLSRLGQAIRTLLTRVGIHRFGGQCMIAAAALSILPLVIMSLIVGPHVSQALMDESTAASSATLDELGRTVQDTVNGRQLDLITISKYPPISGIYRALENDGIDPMDGSTLEQWRLRLTDLFSNYARIHPGTLQVRYLDASGMEWLRVDAVDGQPRTVPTAVLQDKSDREYFLHAAALPAGECYVSPIDLNVDHGRMQYDTPVMRVSTPLWKDGALQGVLVLNVSADSILDQIAHNAASGHIIFATETGVYMSHEDPSKCWGNQLDTDEGLFTDWPTLEYGEERAKLMSSHGESLHLVAADSQTHLAISKIGFGEHNQSWFIGIERLEHEVLGASRAMYRYILFTGLTVGAVAIIAALLLSMLWVRPLKMLARAADAIRSGDYSARVSIKRRDELGDLALSFNEMAGEVGRVIELEEQNASVEAANLAKSEFLANMSHEIRTPMTAIIGFADLLSDPSIEDADREEYAKTIRRNGDHLLHIINDILDLSKIEAGKMGVEAIETSLENVVSQITSLMRGRAEAKGITLNVEYIQPLPPVVQTDPVRLRQVLLNMIGNAIKFTEVGSVGLVVSSHIDNEQGMAELRFEVTDTGIGITAEQIGRLFNPFSQADDSTTRRFGGTGLGLTLSKRFAVMLGGDIDVKSEPGKGSVFTLTLCVPIVNDAAPSTCTKRVSTAALARTKLTGRVLLAEDGPDNRQLIGFLLRKLGLDVEMAENGRIAVDRVMARSDAGNPYDVVLMDMQMPELDGYQATVALREAGYTGHIVALTAHAMAGDRERCLAAGCDDYATKPIEKQELFTLLSNLMSAQRHAA